MDEQRRVPGSRGPVWDDPGWIGLALLALVCFVAPLADGSLRGDSVLYAAVAKRMAVSGEWLEMHSGFSPEPYFNKPPLLIWLTAASFRLFGPSTFAACFWSGIFGVAACLALYALGRDLFGRRAALFSACVYVLTPDVLSKSTRFRLESACAFFLILALQATLRATRQRSPRPLVLAGAAIGLCFMAKGGPGFIALGCVLGTLIWGRAASLLRSRQAALGLALMLGLALLWPLIQWLQHGDAYVEAAFGRELVGRVSRTSAWTAWPYVEHLARRYWPWLPFLVLGAVQLVRERRTRPDAFRLLVIWVGVGIALVSLPAGKSGRYLLSVYPALALICGAWLAPRIPDVVSTGFERWLPRLAVATAVVLVCLPIPLRSDRAAGTRQLGAVLEVHQPELAYVASYGRLRSDVSPQVYFYLDRPLRRLRGVESLEADPARIVIAHDRAGDELERRGWRTLLHTNRWDAYLRPATSIP